MVGPPSKAHSSATCHKSDCFGRKMIFFPLRSISTSVVSPIQDFGNRTAFDLPVLNRRAVFMVSIMIYTMRSSRGILTRGGKKGSNVENRISLIIRCLNGQQPEPFQSIHDDYSEGKFYFLRLTPLGNPEGRQTIPDGVRFSNQGFQTMVKILGRNAFERILTFIQFIKFILGMNKFRDRWIAGRLQQALVRYGRHGG